jgi:hypothetical protein
MLGGIPELGELVLALCFIVVPEDPHEAKAKCCDFVTSHLDFLTA